MLKIKFFTIVILYFVSAVSVAQTLPDMNEPELLQLQLLEEPSQKAPYRYAVRIQLYDCETNCNPIEVYIDHTTMLVSEKGKAKSVYKLKKSEIYKVTKFRMQRKNPRRLEEVVFKNFN